MKYSIEALLTLKAISKQHGSITFFACQIDFLSVYSETARLTFIFPDIKIYRAKRHTNTRTIASVEKVGQSDSNRNTNEAWKARNFPVCSVPYINLISNLIYNFHSRISRKQWFFNSPVYNERLLSRTFCKITKVVSIEHASVEGEIKQVLLFDGAKRLPPPRTICLSRLNLLIDRYVDFATRVLSSVTHKHNRGLFTNRTKFTCYRIRIDSTARNCNAAH